ncbi:LuxR C-terminal-related transcriptional regulator [Actinoplanes sp. CA-054009]
MDELDRVLLGLLTGTSSSRTAVLGIVAARLRTLSAEPAPPTLAGHGLHTPAGRSPFSSAGHGLQTPAGRSPFSSAGHDRFTPAAGYPLVPAGPEPLVTTGRDLLALAWRGLEAETRALVSPLLRGDTVVARATGHYALTILELGLGRYDAAFGHALAVRRGGVAGLCELVVPDLLEAASRSSHPGAVATAARGLDVGVLEPGPEALCRALLGDGDADELYRRAQHGLRDAELARAHLLHGEWLRRRRRRRDAREQLRIASEMLRAKGFAGFAQRAEVELRATAERVGGRGELTAQEAEVARLVAAGCSNREVGQQLFISQNTVQYHLGKVFRKLGIRSRTQLVRVLLERAEPSR